VEEKFKWSCSFHGRVAKAMIGSLNVLFQTFIHFSCSATGSNSSFLGSLSLPVCVSHTPPQELYHRHFLSLKNSHLKPQPETCIHKHTHTHTMTAKVMHMV